MSTITKNQATAILRNLGWRIRTTSEFTVTLKNFQAAWNLGPALSVDGDLGPKTSAALLLSEARRRAGKTTASAHFSFSEVACRCWGRYASCQRIFQKRKAFQMMEAYRAKSGVPMQVVSACRCPSRNKAVGGSPTSQHRYGMACDTQPLYSTSKVKGWRVANNIGYGSVSRRVKHIDMGSGSTVSNPDIYVDGR